MDKQFNLKRPKGVEKYIVRDLSINTYLIFNRKKDTCRCTRCGATHKLSRMSDNEYFIHNEHHFCYDCDSKAICKEERYGRKQLTEYGRILWSVKRGKNTFFQLDEFDLDFTGNEVKVWFWESAQYKFNSKEQKYYKNHPYSPFYGEGTWEARENVKCPKPISGMSFGFAKYERTYLYPEIKQGTDLEYASLNEILSHYKEYNEAEATISYLALFFKYQAIELLWKAGYTQIVKEKIVGETSAAVNWRAKSIRKILKLNNKELKELGNGSIYALNMRWMLRKEGYHVDFKYLDLIGGRYDVVSRLRHIEEYTPYKKALAYIYEQKGLLSDYQDYLDDCNFLGMDMEDKRVLRPKDLREAHQISIKLRNEMKEEIISKGFVEAQEEIVGSMEPFEYGEYLIRPAASPAELATEGQTLHHCVRTYAGKVAEKKCSILFIRKISEPDTPFYTLELSPTKEVEQCRGDHNCGYGDDIERFINVWLKQIKKSKKKVTANAA